ncbi:MAG: hypothetical protein KME42_02105 [Tildeniella nuda ZEHNDER 1965/U140]|nr:hypothetical protein [Tildeniella nuda ZEHNDER 1965/U140]
MTDRERQFLQLLAIGKSNQKIGAKLSMTASTVRSHINHAWASCTSAIACAALSRTQTVVILRCGLMHLVNEPKT